MITIVLADDHLVVRQGLRAVLEAEPDFQVVGEAGEGWEAIQQVQRLRPTVLVLDLLMPGLSGVEALQQLTQQFPSTRVVVLSMHGALSYVQRAFLRGATAYVLKEAGADAFVLGVRNAASGRRYLSPPLSESALAAYAEKSQETLLDPQDTLTLREREVLNLAAKGETSPQIAKRLSISPRTVEVHRAHIMRKLGLSSQTDLVRFALRVGILSSDN